MELISFIIVITLVCLSGLFSGLTLGMMSLDIFELRRNAELGKKKAKKLYPIRKNGNLLLCTLLLGNVAVNAALSVFLGSITNGFAAGLTATTLIVIFGEIIPQASFARFSTNLSYVFSDVTKFFIIIFYPVTKPLSMMLDAILGEELPKAYNKKELKAILEEQQKHKISDLNPEEFKKLKGVLEYSDKKVKDVMTPQKNIFFLKEDETLSKQILERIQSYGHSRIPVLKRSKGIVGMLYSKDLIKLDPSEGKKVSEMMRKNIEFINSESHLEEVLTLFKKRKVHLFIVKNNKGKNIGIITLEDVLEEIVGEIVDEYDRIVDMRNLK